MEEQKDRTILIIEDDLDVLSAFVKHFKLLDFTKEYEYEDIDMYQLCDFILFNRNYQYIKIWCNDELNDILFLSKKLPFKSIKKMFEQYNVKQRIDKQGFYGDDIIILFIIN